MAKDRFMNYGYDDLDDFHISAGDMNLVASLHARFDMLDPKDKENPDIFGCEALFIRFFVNYDMELDFKVIANTFYKNVPEAMEFNKIAYYTDTTAMDTYLLKSFTEFTLSQIYNMAYEENEYASKLLVYLYKTYYKKEYKILKKFIKISSDEVLSVAMETSRANGIDDKCFEGPARILVMCRFMNIEPDESCAFLYYVMGEINTEIEKAENEMKNTYLDSNIEERRKKYFTSGEELMKLFDVNNLEDIEGKCKLYRRYKKFIKDFYTDKGFNPEVNELYIDDDRFLVCMINTYMLLKQKHPNREYTTDDLQSYTMIYIDHMIKRDLIDETEEYFKRVLGEVDDFVLGESIFDPAEFERSAGLVNWRDKDKKTSKTVNEPKVTIKNAEDYDQKMLLEQIADLREKLHKKEYDVHRLSELYNDAKQKIAETEDYKGKYQSEHQELITLREHVFNETEEDIDIPEKTIQEYIKAIENKKIIVIGGHANWVNKMKDMFKNWTYVNFKSTSTIDDSILNNSTEYVFFFTDFIKHHVYYRFMNLVREKHIPFGYIGSININKCIKQIAEEIAAKGE